MGNLQTNGVARKADDEARFARLEIIDSEVIDDSILIFRAWEIDEPYEEFDGSGNVPVSVETLKWAALPASSR
ncbi:hypothetical protein VSX64_24980 [Aurantimonas sp. C2-6-R+9]|uniref:hypothetical protein n=1 Tax=Aurantimonas sp. C2-6-R+9 TaxID=3114365 RepID=UPI002E1896E5|nr:hypothetical protein [Aurantimonas sp. C2-6-R+9]